MRSALSRFLGTAEVLIVMFSLALAGCAGELRATPASTYSLPDLPADLRACFASTVRLPPGAWDSVAVTQVITDLRKSEAGKTDCGRRLIQFYDDARREASGGGRDAHH